MQTQISFTDHSQDYGILYLVATPIGNMEDMTYRAIRILGEVDWIAAEDTRQTRKLLAHFQITGRLVSYHEHNKAASGPELIRLLLEGQHVALVSDAGVPAISDPGYELVRDAVAHGIAVVPIPGANAAISALIISGLPTDRFMYVGFLPRDKKRLRLQLEELNTVSCSIIIYEAPHRIMRTLELMLEAWGDRSIALARELTKKHESIMRGQISECLHELKNNEPRGEYCIVVEGADAAQLPTQEEWWQELSVGDHVEHYLTKGYERKEAMRQTARDRGMSRRDVYNQLL